MCDTMKVTFLNMWLCGHVGKSVCSEEPSRFGAALGDNVENQREGRGQSVSVKQSRLAVVVCVSITAQIKIKISLH